MNLETIWQEFLNIISQEAGSRIVETWFKAVIFSQWDSYSKTVFLKVPNGFVKDWIISNYQPLFHLHLGRLLNEKKLSLIFLDETKGDNFQPARSLEQKINPITNLTNKNNLNLEKKESTSLKVIPTNKSCINIDYKFDSFVVGPNNSLAYAACQAITQRPGILYNPLFIYGASGLGKTHLLHAIGNEIKNNQSRTRILYQTADRFVSDFINAIRFNKVQVFENKYKEIDVLLIDDIQFISNKEQTQESFFHIFNILYEAKKQIVLSCDSMPKDIAGLANRLRSRLDGGLITDIQVPTLETKVAILKKKAELHNENLDDEIAYFIASRVLTNIRELEGYLIRIFAFANLTKEPISLNLAQRVLLPTTNEIAISRTNNLEKIAVAIATHFNFDLQELRSSKRNKKIVLARHAAMFLMKKLTNKSNSEIASFWYRKDHSTVIHALNKFEDSLNNNQELKTEVESISAKLFCQ